MLPTQVLALQFLIAALPGLQPGHTAYPQTSVSPPSAGLRGEIPPEPTELLLRACRHDGSLSTA